MRRLGIVLELTLALIGVFALRALGGGWAMIFVVAAVALAATVWTRIRRLSEPEARRRVAIAQRSSRRRGT